MTTDVGTIASANRSGMEPHRGQGRAEALGECGPLVVYRNELPLAAEHRTKEDTTVREVSA